MFEFLSRDNKAIMRKELEDMHKLVELMVIDLRDIKAGLCEIKGYPSVNSKQGVRHHIRFFLNHLKQLSPEAKDFLARELIEEEKKQ